MTEQDKILGKIKKCLRLAASSNANEAATAMRQAQALMAAHNITLTDVRAAEANSHSAKANVKFKPTKWETILAQTAAKAFSCKLIFFSGVGEWQFIGVEIAPELASYAFGVLLRQAKRDRAEYIKNNLKRVKTKGAVTKRADVYSTNWVWAAESKITAIAPSSSAKTAIAAYMDKHHSKAEDMKSRETKGRQYDSDSHSGYLAGCNANLNRGVDGSTAAAGLEHQL
ncbi:MAG: DUF2786 domain-containing protein [Methylobacter sp.]|uniref:DUF2786 domain-containing protein n=1 Tax=Methylobacter sp. TaxID=2051955 RepID=UPI0025CC6952|nr:DUF2786 domain-containing protein [Methylobacter sp.]MCK9622986.1 DUF2786 domain-containing protein [Methylobacter sp.]